MVTTTEMKRSFVIALLVAGAAVGVATPAFAEAVGRGADRQSVRARSAEMPIFPPSLEQMGIHQGSVRILISVSAEGALTDWLVLAYTHKALANEAVRVLENWTFDPMLLHGQPVACQTEIGFDFESKGTVLSMNPADHLKVLMTSPLHLEYQPIHLRELDRIPRAVLADAPVYPTDLEEQGIVGGAIVEFYIDELGTVRMPAVVEADHLELGHIAVEAVLNWRFEVPVKDGRPALTRVLQQFNFGDKAALASAAGK